MKKIVEIPEDVNIELEGMKVTIKGKKGEVFKNFRDAKYRGLILLKKEDNKIIIESKTDRKKLKAVVGTIVSHLKNMFIGVTKGFEYKMKVVYTHFPISVSVEGDEVHIKNFLGEKKDRVAKIVGDSKVTVNKEIITIEGPDREAVGQTAGNIEQKSKIVAKDRRVFSDGVFIIAKGIAGEVDVKSESEPVQTPKHDEKKGENE